jgi:hypothetical protein
MAVDDDDERPRARYTNNELALLITGLGKTLEGFAAEVRSSMSSFLLKQVYEADQTTRKDALTAIRDEIANVKAGSSDARAIAMWAVGLTVAVVAALATTIAVVVTR